MSPNQRNRGNRGNKSGNNSNNNNSGTNAGQKNGNGAGQKKGAANRPADVKDFWGESAAPLPSIGAPTSTGDPSAMVRSLGKPPLPGNDNAAEHYFAAVYERSAVLAGALSAALLE